MNNQLISMEGIEKYFPGVHALKQCRFDLKAGEVHALVGENGAGKSTLMKILTGVLAKDEGRIVYKGKDISIPSPKAALDMGICIIHQEFNLMPHLTVAENIYIGREPYLAVKPFLNDRALNSMAKELLDSMHLRLDTRKKVADLTVAMQQMVEIAKALSYNSEVLIMDEPTAALTDSEIEELFRIIRQLRQRGVGVVYISHRMEELKKISDRITIMRDGKYIDTVDTEKTMIDRIISMMVGREIYESSNPYMEKGSSECVLEVKNLKRGRAIKNVSFRLKRGEILGFAGLMGAGRTEVARAIFGADAVESGEVYVSGEKVRINSPSDAIRHGIGYLSEDRKRYGLTLTMDVETNIVLANFKKYINFAGLVNKQRTGEEARHRVNELSIKTPGIYQKVKNLSGGNQQKVVISKWLTRDCDILIFDEPTRGIDVGAKSEIYKLLNDLTERGKSIIMISSELPEIMRMSHRIIVMCEGRITGELDGGTATQEEIMQYATKREASNLI